MAGLLLNFVIWLNPQVTDIDRWTCERVVPLEVMVFGCSRTGTSSIREALKQLGYNDVYHAKCIYDENPRDADMWVDAIKAKYDHEGKPFERAEWDKLLGHCMAVSDIPVTFFIPELLDAYPEAKVILSMRDSPEAWWRSIEQTLIPMTARFYMQSEVWKRIYNFFLPRLRFNELNEQITSRNSTEDFIQNGSNFYIEHNKGVTERVKERQEKIPGAGGMLEYNVKQGWGPLCEFLEKPVPVDEKGEVLPFPRKNDAASFNRTSKGIKVFLDVMVGFNIALTVVSTGAIGYGLYVAYKRRA